MKKIRILFLFILIFLLSSCGYNQILANEETVNSAWGNVQSAYQRRLDLVPNLAAVVNAYADYEQETFTAVIEARANAAKLSMPENSEAMQQLQAGQNQLQTALSRMILLAENYPNLKANQNFMDLQHQLSGTENRINVARRRYNEAVREFNISIRTFPYNITNRFFLHMVPKTAFTTEEVSK